MSTVERFWKRGEVLVDGAGNLGVFGAFSRTPVSSDAWAVCLRPAEHGDGPGLRVKDGCWCGFNAHSTRLHALRYPPRDTTLLHVELGEPLETTAHGRYVVGRHQRLVGAEFFAFCAQCEGEVVAEKLGLVMLDAAWSVVTPLCPTHLLGRSIWDPQLSSIAVQRTSLEMSHYVKVHTHDARVPTRCPCRFVDEVMPDRGLAHYFRDLWRVEGSVGELLIMRCVVCGSRWMYQRRVLPQMAWKMTGPGALTEKIGAEL